MGRQNICHFVPESKLRAIWMSKILGKRRLHTSTNQPLEIVFPGELNSDSGPDFHDAVIRIGSLLCRGDVEIHRRGKEWFEHKHHHDEAYNSVILHVIWCDDLRNSFTATQSGRIIPSLVLNQYLDASQPLLIFNAEKKYSRESPCFVPPCSSLRPENIPAVKEWINKLGMKRIELKVRGFDERLHELIENRRRSIGEPRQKYGVIPFAVDPDDLPPPKINYSSYEARDKSLWDQLLYEGCMEALGYTKNQEPFLRLARILPLDFVRECFSEVTETERVEYIESLFFGAARLLPVPRNGMDRESKKKLCRLRRIYRKLKQDHPHDTIRKSAWRFFRLRPENFPTIRLAGASILCSAIIERNIFREIIQCIKDQDISAVRKFKILASSLLISADEFWNRHYRFGECSGRSIRMLVGSARAKEMVANIVIPLALLYARVFKDRCVRELCMNVLRAEVTIPMNSVIRRIAGTLFPQGKIEFSVLLYQGLLHLYRSHCTVGLCNLCEIKIICRGKD